VSYVALGASLEDALADRVERIVRTQVDRGVDVALDSAGARFDRFLDSPAGQAVMDKFEAKTETALTNILYKNRWNIALGVISAAALTTIGVSYGTKVERRGVGIAAGIALAAALPLLLKQQEQPPAPVPARRTRQ